MYAPLRQSLKRSFRLSRQMLAFCFLLTVCLSTGFSTPACAQSIANAGFEAPSLGPAGSGAYQYAPAGASWTFLPATAPQGSSPSGAGISGNASGFTNGNPSAPEGVQVGVIQGGGSISQSVSGFQAGVPYTLTVSAAQRNFQAGSQTVEVNMDGASLGALRPSDTTYSDFSFTYTAPASGSHTLQFLGLNPNGGDNTVFLDNIRIVQAGRITIPNGGFEAPSLGPAGSGAYQYAPAGASWTFLPATAPQGSSPSGAGISGNASGFTNGNPSAPEGVQVGVIQGGGSISQSVSGFQAGVPYTLTVSAAQRNFQASSQTVQINMDGAQIGLLQPGGTGYQDYSFAYRPTASGAHTLQFLGLNPSGGDNTVFLDNVRVVGGAAGTPALRVDAGSSTAYADSQGKTWAADNAYTGGTTTTTTSAVTGTPDSALYQTQRTGSTFSYTLPAANGVYVLGLLFAEIEGNTTSQRIFTVTTGTRTLLDHFDIFAAGANTAFSRAFIVKATGGQITLTFTGNTGNAAVAGLLLAPLPAGGGVIPSLFGQSDAAPDLPEPDWAGDTIPTDDASDADGIGPAASDSTNLASGVAENNPGPDLWAYNPVGPTASYERLYRSARAAQGYASPGLSAGWTDNCDLSVMPTSDGYRLTYDNGATEAWTGLSGSLTTPAGAPYLANASGDLQTLTMTFKDRSQYTFTQVSTSGGNYLAHSYLLAKISNLVGHAITLNRDTAANGYRLLSITNDAATPTALLSFAYDGNGNLQTVTDAYGRQITYGFTGGTLTAVSQIAAAGATGTAPRWQYGYSPVLGAPFLTSVQSPDPSHPGSLATAYTDYYDNGVVALRQDATGRIRSYSYTGPQTQVQAYNADGSLAQTWTQKLGIGAAKNVDTGIIDAAGKSTSIAYAATPSPYLPSAATNRNHQTSQVTYDPANSYANVLTAQSPRGVVMTTTYQYPSDFPLGQPASAQRSHVNASGGTDSSLTPTFLHYNDSTAGPFNGLVSEVDTPLPDTVQGTVPTVPTTYVYDPTPVNGLPLGNVQTVTTLGAHSTPSIPSTYTTVTYSYTNGTVTMPALGEPLTVTVNGSPSNNIAFEYYSAAFYIYPPSFVLNTQTTAYRYDSRGNAVSVTDGSGYETDHYYNLADQLQAVVYPATNPQTPSARAVEYYTYQYPGGPLASVTVYNEGAISGLPALGTPFPQPSANPVREVDYTYTPEGETTSVTGSTQPAHYVYDGRGRVASVMDGNGSITSYVYDAVGNLTKELFPLYAPPILSDSLTYTYDDDQNLLTRTGGRGVTTTLTRTDPESLVTQIAYSNLPANVTAIAPVGFTYDSYGRRLMMTDGTGATSYGDGTHPGYDDLDNLLWMRKDFAGGPQDQVMTFNHYQDGSRSALTTPANVSNALTMNSGQFGYQYDGVGRLAQLTVPHLGNWLHYRYQANGWLSATYNLDVAVSANDPNGMQSSSRAYYSYNARGFLTKIDHGITIGWYGEAVGPQFVMTYDVMGNRLTENAGHNTPYIIGYSPDLTYVYDTAHAQASQNRDVLLQEQGLPGTKSVYDSTTGKYVYMPPNTFSYDPAYNLTTFSAKEISRTYGANTDNQLTNLGFAFDGDGNPTTYQGATFSFDPEDRLAAISSPAFAASYDGDGLRATKTVNGNTTYFLYDGTEPVIEETFNGAVASISAVNTFGVDGWRARYYPGGTFYTFLFNPQGSMTQKENATSHSEPLNNYYTGYAGPTSPVAYSNAVYEAYGVASVPEQAPGNDYLPPAQIDPVGFGGQYGYYTDRETGLVLMGHRSYDPGTGRFLTRDPLGYGGGMNLYGYADGNPVNESDPDGFSPIGYAANVVGLVPGPVGMVANLVGAVDSVAEGDYVGAALSVAGEIPILGEGAVAAKIARLAVKVRRTTRLESAFAKIGVKHLGTGTVTNRASRAFARKLGYATDDAGHAVGSELGGSGSVRSGNIFPQNVGVNRGDYARFEGMIANQVKSGKSVFVRVRPRYSTPTSTRPYEILYQARINGKTISRVFPNP